MAQKVLFQTKLTDLETTDVEGLGNLRFEDNKWYIWQKNYGYTALAALGPCLQVLSSVAGGIRKRVNSPDTSATYTASQLVPAGQPVTGIAPSGSATGDHGWVLVRGPIRANVGASSVAGTVGMSLQGTSMGVYSNICWALMPTTHIRGGAVLLEPAIVAAYTEPFTSTLARSGSIYVNCLS